MGKETYYGLYKTKYQSGYIMNEFKTLEDTITHLSGIVNDNNQYVVGSVKVLTGFELKVTIK